IPLERWGVKVISIGFIVDEGAPMVWRGPMASSALNQLLNDVAWGSAAEPLDILVVDMTPGTGGIPLTLVQRVPPDAAVPAPVPQAFLAAAATIAEAVTAPDASKPPPRIVFED